jgi:hypothetical protein
MREDRSVEGFTGRGLVQLVLGVAALSIGAVAWRNARSGFDRSRAVFLLLVGSLAVALAFIAPGSGR